ncbi:VOC family protein [Candidatus Peregrinibacteria bacterium]|nr:VOC family protein [Candidatus Peregrinibacteria bacterium]
MLTINPYINFNGNCEEVFNFYKSIFGGELQLSRFKDAPADGMPGGLSEQDANKVLHVTLKINENTVLMGSDCPPSFPAVTFGNGYNVSINITDETEGQRIFDALSAGGKVFMPYQKTFWGAVFGMTSDKFGVQWMINCDLGQQK